MYSGTRIWDKNKLVASQCNSCEKKKTHPKQLYGTRMMLGKATQPTVDCITVQLNRFWFSLFSVLCRMHVPQHLMRGRYGG